MILALIVGTILLFILTGFGVYALRELEVRIHALEERLEFLPTIVQDADNGNEPRLVDLAVIKTKATNTQLLLCDKNGELETEIAWHQDEIPAEYHYGGKSYKRMTRRDKRGRVEYRRS